MTEKKETPSGLQEGESLLNFPEKFPIKIFGQDSDAFKQSIKQTIDTHVEAQQQISWQENTSSKGNYLAITVTIMAQSQTQLDAIYMDLTANKLVKMAL